MESSTQNRAKKAIALHSFKEIKQNSHIGIGTGSTVFFLIEELIKHEQHLSIKVAFSSSKSHDLLKNTSYGRINDSLDENIDLTIDGADYVSSDGTLIKGGGGALTREKILIASSKKSIIIIDESKFISKKTKVKLPIEILPFGFESTVKKLKHIQLNGSIRKKESGQNYITDNHNLIFDAEVEFPFMAPKELHNSIKEIAGVVETGIFIDFPIEVWIAFFDEKKAIQKLKFNS